MDIVGEQDLADAAPFAFDVCCQNPSLLRAIFNSITICVGKWNTDLRSRLFVNVHQIACFAKKNIRVQI